MKSIIVGFVTGLMLVAYNKTFANNELSVLNLVIPCVIGGISIAILKGLN